MHIGEKIRQVRRSKDLTQEYVAEKVGITPAYVSQIENGKNDPDSELIKKFASALGVPATIFFEEDVAPLIHKPKKKTISDENEIGKKYPVISRIQSGNGGINVTENVLYYDDGPVGDRYRNCVYFEVKGDSMEPKWEAGDLVLCNPKVMPKHGEFGVACWAQEDGALKRIFYQQESIALQSINPKYESITIRKEDVWFLGVVEFTKHRK